MQEVVQDMPGGDVEHAPRHLFATVEAGMREEVLKSNAP